MNRPLDPLRVFEQKQAKFEQEWNKYRGLGIADLHALLLFVREELERLETEFDRLSSLARNRDQEGTPLRVEKATEYRTVREAWAAEPTYQTVKEAADEKLSEYSDEHARYLALRTLLLYRRKAPAGDVGRWDQLSDEEKALLDFSPPNKRQSFNEDVQREAVRKWQSYESEGMKTEEAREHVRAWLKEQSGRDVQDSTLYIWKDKHGELD